MSLDESHKPQHWVKVIASQWFWAYEFHNYTDELDDFTVGTLYSNINLGEDLNDESLRLLETDLYMSVPNQRFTRFMITSNDVIHSFAIPSLGLKLDACPGRINAATLLPTKRGMFYGQCSELCGINHGFMPICLEVY